MAEELKWRNRVAAIIAHPPVQRNFLYFFFGRENARFFCFVFSGEIKKKRNSNPRASSFSFLLLLLLRWMMMKAAYRV
jgi:hypothetical protein